MESRGELRVDLLAVLVVQEDHGAGDLFRGPPGDGSLGHPLPDARQGLDDHATQGELIARPRR